MTDKALYRSVAGQLPLFFKPWWVEAVHVGNWDVAVQQKHGKVLAAWPYTIEKKALFTILRNPLLTPYFGPLWLAETPPVAGWAEALRQQLPQADFLQWSTLPGAQLSFSAAVHHLQQRRKRTFYIDLGQAAETLWANVHPKRKNDIRKAEEDLQVSGGFMDINEFIRWHSASFSGKGKKYPYSAAFLQRLLDAAAANNASKAYMAKDRNGRIAGQVWTVYDRDTMYYLLSAAPGQAHRGAIALLIWEALLEAKAAGLRHFDFEGSMDEGIAFYFRRFGGREIPYDEFSMTNSALWKLKQKIMG